ncbi:MAG TPA: Panacea domain-containing protein [Arenimonas sp.]|nr:Panacea domain-containing protein [Arenimonas sp.]
MNHTELFDDKKAAQAAAYFLFKAGGRLPVLKLMKLMYLAERKSYELFSYPITGDSMVSMDHGPVLSITLNNVNGMSSNNDCWDEVISDRDGHDVALKDPSTIRSDEDLRDLSESDVISLKAIWDEFGHMTKYQIRDYTHEALPEWQNPNGSSFPIRVERLLDALGFSEEKKQNVLTSLQLQAGLKVAIHRMKHVAASYREPAETKRIPA